MYRIFKISSVPLGGTTFFTQRSGSLQSFNKKIFNAKKSEKPAHYSTVLGHKILEHPTLSKKKSQIKLRAKPYEELLKVLESREKSLKSKHKLTKDKETNSSPEEVKKSFAKPKKKTSSPKTQPAAGKEEKNVLSERPEEFGRSPLNISLHADVLKARDKALKAKNKLTEDKDSASETNNSTNPSGEGIFAMNWSFAKPKKKKKSSPKTQEKAADEPDKAAKKKKKLSKKDLSERQEEFKKSLKLKHALSALKSYVEVSINANEVDKAQQFFYWRLEKLKKKFELDSIDVNQYNVLISGWSQKGKLERVKQLMSMMEKDGVSPNLQTYAHYFECLSRGKFLDVTEIQNAASEMKSKGLSHQDILSSCIFVGNQREKVIEALGYVDRNFSPAPSSPSPSYSCKLLERLNDPSHERGTSQPDFCFEAGDIPTLAESQLLMENHFSQRIKSVSGIKSTKNTPRLRKYLQECEESWKEKLTHSINLLKSGDTTLRVKGSYMDESTHPYFAVLDTGVLVNILLQEVRMLTVESGESYGQGEKYLWKRLGTKVMNHYFIWLNRRNEITDKVHLVYQKYLAYLLDPELLSKYSPREYWEHLKTVHSSGPTIDIAETPWPHSVLWKIGAELYELLQMHIAIDKKIIENQAPGGLTQAIYQDQEEHQNLKKKNTIKCIAPLCKLYREAQLDYLEFDATFLPMLSPPKPWIKHDSGGLLITRTPFMRVSDHAVYQSNFYGTIPQQQLNPCFDSLNSLSLCPWIINKPLLDLIIDVFRKGGNEELEIPLDPNSFPPSPKVKLSMSKEEKNKAWKQREELNKKKKEMASLWFDCLYKLSIANHFRDKVFWFPHNLDFRGRVYPTPPHFNHLGSDMARSILLFAEGKPLGKEGLDWLKIHLINLTGFKKRDPHSVRLEFANEMIPEILDSADRPFEGNQWWRTSDKPWQTLACCKELANALRHPGGNPEEYVSHFPIHQDGSCNGLQHYAALGRDALGAIEVNLHPSDAPQDVYSGVSALVERERQSDAAAGDEDAKALEGFVRRKVVKQTVMTYVYGVTRYGASLQILKQLKDIPEFPEKLHGKAASSYLMKKIFLSIKEMFTATQEIQDWFTNCAEHITRCSDETLEWVTPLGLPVIQPYHKETRLSAPNVLFSHGSSSTLQYYSHSEPYQSPNVRKQKNGFAPNFIHSLDASHMMLTSLYCQRKGITFVSVHDCFWTHASSVAIMNKVCREQFVSLHSQPILEDLSSFFMEKYARVLEEKIIMNKNKDNPVSLKLKDLLCRVPKKGTFDLKKVLESEYFFS